MRNRPLSEPDFYERVTAQIVAALEAGTPPWVRPWSTLGDQRPRNALSGRGYRGINTWLLTAEAAIAGYVLPRWLTFRQADGLGARVRRGEHGTRIVYYRVSELPDRDAAAVGSTRLVPLMRAFTVFNVAQVDGLPETYLAPTPAPADWVPTEAAEQLLLESGADIRMGGDRAFYQPDLDFIQLPLAKAFGDGGSFYGTALHELTHWTGHASRCARSLTGRFGDAAYAMEELIAEMGSAYLCAHCRLDGQLQHPSYLAHWLDVLRADKRAIFTAATKAQQAADHLVGDSDSSDRVDAVVEAA